jgi:hypothetical protein
MLQDGLQRGQGRGACQEHGCFCQEYFRGSDKARCGACRHHESYHSRWVGADQVAERIGYGKCEWAKVEEDSSGFAVLDKLQKPVKLRDCMCTEFAIDDGNGDPILCSCCRHHRSFHKILLGTGTIPVERVVVPQVMTGVGGVGRSWVAKDIVHDEHLYGPFSHVPAPAAPAVEPSPPDRGKGKALAPSGQCSNPEGSAATSVGISFSDKVHFKEWKAQLPGTYFPISFHIQKANM